MLSLRLEWLPMSLLEELSRTYLGNQGELVKIAAPVLAGALHGFLTIGSVGQRHRSP